MIESQNIPSGKRPTWVKSNSRLFRNTSFFNIQGILRRVLPEVFQTFGLVIGILNIVFNYGAFFSYRVLIVARCSCAVPKQKKVSFILRTEAAGLELQHLHQLASPVLSQGL